MCREPLMLKCGREVGGDQNVQEDHFCSVNSITKLRTYPMAKKKRVNDFNDKVNSKRIGTNALQLNYCKLQKVTPRNKKRLQRDQLHLKQKNFFGIFVKKCKCHKKYLSFDRANSFNLFRLLIESFSSCNSHRLVG